MRAHKYPFPTHVTVGVDLTKPLGMVVDDDLYVIDEVNYHSILGKNIGMPLLLLR